MMFVVPEMWSPLLGTTQTTTCQEIFTPPDPTETIICHEVCSISLQPQVQMDSGAVYVHMLNRVTTP